MSSPMSVDEIVRLFEAHQQIGTLTDACTCGAGDMSNREERGISTVEHWRHLARVIQVEMRMHEEAR